MRFSYYLFGFFFRAFYDTFNVTNIERNVFWLLVTSISNILHIHERHKIYFHIDIDIIFFNLMAERVVVEVAQRRNFLQVN